VFGPENQGRSQAIAATTTTKRLRLRALTGDEILAALWTRRLPDGGPWPVDDLGVLAYRADQVERLEDQAEASFLLWVATTPQGDYVGRVGCHAPPSAEGVVEIGYYVREVHRGRGLAHEMVNAFISWLTAHDVRRVRAMVRPGNHASITVLRSVGFGPTGRSVVDAEDGLEDEYCLAITSVSHVLAADQERLGRGAAF
jgi:RimJ/RimL family protein N-acetyltransferase